MDDITATRQCSRVCHNLSRSCHAHIEMNKLTINAWLRRAVKCRKCTAEIDKRVPRRTHTAWMFNHNLQVSFDSCSKKREELDKIENDIEAAISAEVHLGFTATTSQPTAYRQLEEVIFTVSSCWYFITISFCVGKTLQQTPPYMGVLSQLKHARKTSGSDLPVLSSRTGRT